MFEQIQQVKILLAMIQDNYKSILHENEKLRKDNLLLTETNNKLIQDVKRFTEPSIQSSVEGD